MNIKRTLSFIEEIAEEAGQCIDPPLRKVAVAAIIDNPFAGRFERDLKPLTDASEPVAGGGKPRKRNGVIEIAARVCPPAGPRDETR